MLGAHTNVKRIITSVLILCVIVGGLGQVSKAQAAKVNNFTLYGSYVSGWGFSNNNITSPGPVIRVDLQDTVTLTLINNDTGNASSIRFLLSYENSSIQDSHDVVSPNIGPGQSVVLTFTANVSGTFTYYCTFHPNVMYGTFVVNSIFWLKELPYVTLFVFGLGAVISLLTTSANRLLTNPEQAKAVRKEVGEWNKELRAAQRDKDKKTVDKLMKKQQYMMQLQSKTMWQSMKVSLLFLIPLLIMWQLLGQFLTGTGGSFYIAILPGVGSVLPLPFFSASLIWWYLLASLLFGTVFSHVFGITEVSE